MLILSQSSRDLLFGNKDKTPQPKLPMSEKASAPVNKDFFSRQSSNPGLLNKIAGKFKRQAPPVPGREYRAFDLDLREKQLAAKQLQQSQSSSKPTTQRSESPSLPETENIVSETPPVPETPIVIMPGRAFDLNVRERQIAEALGLRAPSVPETPISNNSTVESDDIEIDLEQSRNAQVASESPSQAENDSDSLSEEVLAKMRADIQSLNQTHSRVRSGQVNSSKKNESVTPLPKSRLVLEKDSKELSEFEIVKARLKKQASALPKLPSEVNDSRSASKKTAMRIDALKKNPERQNFSLTDTAHSEVAGQNTGVLKARSAIRKPASDSSVAPSSESDDEAIKKADKTTVDSSEKEAAQETEVLKARRAKRNTASDSPIAPSSKSDDEATESSETDIQQLPNIPEESIYLEESPEDPVRFWLRHERLKDLTDEVETHLKKLEKRREKIKNLRESLKYKPPSLSEQTMGHVKSTTMGASQTGIEILSSLAPAKDSGATNEALNKTDMTLTNIDSDSSPKKLIGSVKLPNLSQQKFDKQPYAYNEAKPTKESEISFSRDMKADIENAFSLLKRIKNPEQKVKIQEIEEEKSGLTLGSGASPIKSGRPASSSTANDQIIPISARQITDDPAFQAADGWILNNPATRLSIIRNSKGNAKISNIGTLRSPEELAEFKKLQKEANTVEDPLQATINWENKLFAAEQARVKAKLDARINWEKELLADAEKAADEREKQEAATKEKMPKSISQAFPTEAPSKSSKSLPSRLRSLKLFRRGSKKETPLTL